MAASLVGVTKYEAPASGGSAASRTLTLPAGIQDNDLIVIALSKNGSANGFTLSGLSFTLLDNNSTSGHWSAIYYRTAASSDSGASVTIATSAAYRVSAVAVVLRGVDGVNIFSKATLASGTSLTAPAATPTLPSVRLDFACTSGGDATGISISTAAGMTETGAAYDKATSGSGYANTKGARNLSPVSTPVAAQTYSTSSTTAVAGTGWTLLISTPVASTDAVPVALVSNVGSWTNEGGAASIPAALADADDATFARSPASPTSAAMQVKYGLLADGLVTVSYDADMDTGTGSCVVTLYQGATSIASWTDSWTTTKQTFVHTTSSGQAAAITDRADLRTTFSLTAT